jgi:hypothetical protein
LKPHPELKALESGSEHFIVQEVSPGSFVDELRKVYTARRRDVNPIQRRSRIGLPVFFGGKSEPVEHPPIVASGSCGDAGQYVMW